MKYCGLCQHYEEVEPGYCSMTGKKCEWDNDECPMFDMFEEDKEDKENEQSRDISNI